MITDRMMMAQFDVHTRWLCPECGGAGVDSWHKTVFDGLHWEGCPPEDLGAYSFFCLAKGCTHFLIVDYRSSDLPPRCIVAGSVDDATDELEAKEEAAFAAFAADRMAGVELKPADTRDGDWSGCCLNVQPAPPMEGGDV